MGMVFGKLQAEIHIKDNGSQINNKVMEFTNTLIVFTKVILGIFLNMVKENNNFLTEIIMMDSIIKEDQMDGVYIDGVMEINIRVSLMLVFAKDMEL
jgi:hypothetical protein